MQVDKSKIITAVPKIATYLDFLLEAAKKYDINTPLRLAHWLGQMAHESGGFTRLFEDLNYSAVRMSQVWPGRYAIKNAAGKSVPGSPNATAIRLANNPTALANNVYANRLGNGDEASGEGWKFRGRGLKMLTGKDNYRTYSRLIYNDEKVLLNNPDLASDAKGTSYIAAAFWKQNGLNSLADKDDMYNITQRINGGQVGADDRKKRVALFKSLL